MYNLPSEITGYCVKKYSLNIRRVVECTFSLYCKKKSTNHKIATKFVFIFVY